MEYQPIHNAHGELVSAVDRLTKPGFVPIPVSLVSVSDKPGAQMVIFDGTKFTKEEVTKRLRIAADFLDTQP
jgi:hypothetical protein